MLIKKILDNFDQPELDDRGAMKLLRKSRYQKQQSHPTAMALSKMFSKHILESQTENFLHINVLEELLVDIMI